MESNLKRAVAYVRVSTERQADEDRYGLDAQRKAITLYAERNGYEITRWYEEHVSGAKDLEEREVLASLLFDKDIENPPYDAVIVFKNDRVARDMKLYFYYLYLLEKRGVALISVEEDFGGDPALANIYRAIMGFVAEQERKNIALRTSSGRKIKRSRGGYSCGRPPYGYRTIDGVLKADRKESPIVERILSSRESGMAYNRIATELNSEGIRTKDGSEWFSNTVKRICENVRFYEGYVTVDGNEMRGEQEILWQGRKL